MSSERVDLYVVRFVESANVCMFGYLALVIDATRPARSESENLLTNFILVLAGASFFVALITSFRKKPSESKWLLIRATHQALAIVSIAIAAISLVGLPDTAPVTIYVAVLALLQVAALRASRRSVLNASHLRPWPITALRVAMVFLFAFLFLLMK